MDSVIKILNSLIDFSSAHTEIVVVLSSLMISIVATEIAKNLIRVFVNGGMKNKKFRRTVHLTTMVTVHWLIVWRMYSVTNGPFLFDVVVFSPIVSAGAVWLIHRFIEYKACSSGPNSMWMSMLVKLKPHRLCKDISSADKSFDPELTTKINYEEGVMVIKKNRRKK